MGFRYPGSCALVWLDLTGKPVFRDACADGGAGTGLRRVDLSDNPMTGEAAPALAAMLRRHPRLKAVNLGDTSLGDDGVSAVLGGLQASASSLQVHSSTLCVIPCIIPARVLWF